MFSRKLFAAGVSAALLLGVASPAMAQPAKDPKPPKAPSGHITGVGLSDARAYFDIAAKQNNLSKGGFGYVSADGKVKVVCNGFDSYSPIVYIQAGPPAAHVMATCVERGKHGARSKISLDATFVDASPNGRKDQANITLTRPDGSQISDSGVIRRGNIEVR